RTLRLHRSINAQFRGCGSADLEVLVGSQNQLASASIIVTATNGGTYPCTIGMGIDLGNNRLQAITLCQLNIGTANNHVTSSSKPKLHRACHRSAISQRSTTRCRQAEPS